MDFRQIQELIKIINKSNIGELSIEDENFKITIKQKEEKVQTVVSAPAPAPVFVPTPAVVAIKIILGRKSRYWKLKYETLKSAVQNVFI